MPETPWKTSKMVGMDETPVCTCGTCEAMRVDRERRHVAALLSEVYEDEGVRIWMSSPHRWFNGESAEALIAAGRSAEVLAAVQRLLGGAWA